MSRWEVDRRPNTHISVRLFIEPGRGEIYFPFLKMEGSSKAKECFLFCRLPNKPPCFFFFSVLSESYPEEKS